MANRNPRKKPASKQPVKSTIRLNRFIAQSGLCSRRDADELIRSGAIKVNGKIVVEMGYQVASGDQVIHRGKVLAQEKFVYVLLNKPKDFITTTDDPQNRRTVMDLVAAAGNHRLFPVGRLDRNTTGLLLLTNDGDLAKKLTHPSHEVPKIYHVIIDKSLSKNDLETIMEGVQLDDGLAKVDKIEVLDKKLKEFGLEIHMGKNRIVRRIFEHFDHEVVKLDRVMYADLTKKDLPRGKWRFLKEKEVTLLKHF